MTHTDFTIIKFEDPDYVFKNFYGNNISGHITFNTFKYTEMGARVLKTYRFQYTQRFYFTNDNILFLILTITDMRYCQEVRIGN